MRKETENEVYDKYLAHPKHFGVVGRTSSGKSLLLRWLIDGLFDHGQIEVLFIVSETAQTDDEYTQWAEGRNNIILVNVRDAQWEVEDESAPSKGKKKKMTLIEACTDLNKTRKAKGQQQIKCCVLFDDVTGFFIDNGEDAKKLSGQITTARHNNVRLIFSVHGVKAVMKPLIRDNLHTWILPKNTSDRNLQSLAEHLGYNKHMYGKSINEMYTKIMYDQPDYSFMLIAAGSNLQFCVIRAPDPRGSAPTGSSLPGGKLPVLVSDVESGEEDHPQEVQ